MARRPLLILAALVALLGPTGAQAAPERRLVVLRSGTAVASPDRDFTRCLEGRYTLKGNVDTLHRLDGLAVRLLGEWGEEEVLVPGPRPGGPLPALLAPPDATRGRLQAEVLSVEPPRARLDLGAGRRRDVDLEWEGPAPPAWTALSRGSLCTLEATLTGSKALDVRVGAPRSASARRGPVRVVAQMSEGFLQAAVTRYRKAHPEPFRWTDPQGSSSLEVSELGLTLLDCAPGQVRLFGALTGSATVLGTRLPDVEGQWEVVAVPVPQGAELELDLVPGTLRVRLARPLHLAVPAGWSARVQALLEAGLDQGFRLPVPGAWWKDLVATGALRASDLSRMEVLTRPTGDRRTGLVVVAGPVEPEARDSGPDLLRDRLRDPEGFAVALSAAAMNDVLDRQVPGLLPLRQALPPQARIRQSVLFLELVIDAVEVSELDLDYLADEGRGVLGINRLTANVHWSLGPFSGWEPGARLKGRAWVESRPGPPLALVAHPDVSEVEFLSEHLRSRSAEEQQVLRKRVADGLRAVPLDVLLPAQAPVAALGPGAVLELRDFQALAEELVLQGRFMPGPPSSGRPDPRRNGGLPFTSSTRF